MSYFEQTKTGESRWWSWMAVTWLAFVGWVLLQTVLLFPLPVIASFTEPPLIDALMNSFSTMDKSPTANSLGDLSIWAALGATGAIFVSLLSDDRTRKISNILALSGIVVFIVTTRLSNQGADSTELMNVITRIMGASPLATKIHKRSLLSLHTAASKFRWNRVLQGFFLTWIVLGTYAFAAHHLGITNVEYIFAGGKFWIFALASLLFIPLQSATEEIVFRGYFNQGFTHFFKSKWLAFAITSLAFMAMHLSNPEALEGTASGTLPIVMSGYFFFGFAMCLVVWIDDGLETAIGIHAGNNCFAAIIMNYENSVLPTPSVFLTGVDPVKDSVSTIVVLATLVAILWFWRRRSGSRAL